MDENDQRDQRAWVHPQTEFIRAVFREEPLVEKGVREIWDMPDGPDRVGALRKWRERWNLTEPWCKDEAFSLLFDLDRQYWEDVSTRRWFKFECAGWDPRRPKTSEREIHAAFEAAFKEHKATREEEYRRMHWIDPADHHTRAHYVWAARFQVSGETFTQIAKSVGTSHQNVTKMIRETLRRIDLTSRHVKKGRPKKSAR